MSLLSALIQKRETGKAATAIPAIFATQHDVRAATVARIATVAVANPTDSKTADAVTSWGWLLHFADREPLEIYCSPQAGHAAILERYPDALAAEPLPERTRREPNDAEAKELRALVQAVAEREGWAAAEVEEATALALADPDGALTCYRDIAADLKVILWPDDDRRTCNRCANLEGRRCLAAWRGEIVANRDYTPIRDIPRRCEGYIPDANDPDRRSGRERWPELIDEGA